MILDSMSQIVILVRRYSQKTDVRRNSLKIVNLDVILSKTVILEVIPVKYGVLDIILPKYCDFERYSTKSDFSRYSKK